MHKHKFVFDGDGTAFSAFREAGEFIEKHGGRYGSMERGSPMGVIMRDDVIISKWRNLSQKERLELDGTLSAGREGQAVLYLNIDLPAIAAAKGQ